MERKNHALGELHIHTYYSRKPSFFVSYIKCGIRDVLGKGTTVKSQTFVLQHLRLASQVAWYSCQHCACLLDPRI